MERLDPIIALSDAQRLRLAYADPLDAGGVLRMSGELTLDQLAGAPFFVNARTMLTALDDAPVRATRELGHLELRFVARMLDELQFGAEAREWLRYVSRRPHEADVRPLHVLRVVLQLAGLIKKRTGHFSLTQRGRRLLSPDGAAGLYEALFRTYFGKFNIFYVGGGREDRQLQRRIVLALWTIRRFAEHPVDGARIARLMPRDGVVWSPRDGYVERSPEAFEYAVRRVLLEPLRGFGLLRGGERVGDWASRERAPWHVTPLFDTVISFDLEEAAVSIPDGRPGRRHLRLVPDAAEGAPGGEAATGAEADAAEAVAADPSPGVAQLLVTLRHVDPPVWRRLVVPADSTFDQLHRYINTAVGWLDYHLHEFEVGRRRIAASDADWEGEWPREDEMQVTLQDALADRVRTFLYRYDFGDAWEHDVVVERVAPADPEVFYPYCIEAAGACPPEDCGGPHGYLELLRASAAPDDPDNAELLEWLEEPLDPGRVDLDGIDRLLHLAATGEIRPEDLDYFSGE